MTKLEESMGIIVSRKKRRAMALPPRPERMPQSPPDSQEPSVATQEDVLRSNDDENESDPDEKSEASDECHSETLANDEEFHENERDEHNSSESASSAKSSEIAKDVSDIVEESETSTTEVDEFNSAWKKVFLDELDIKISDNAKIVRIFTSSTFTGKIWSLSYSMSFKKLVAMYFNFRT